MFSHCLRAAGVLIVLSLARAAAAQPSSVSVSTDGQPTLTRDLRLELSEKLRGKSAWGPAVTSMLSGSAFTASIFAYWILGVGHCHDDFGSCEDSSSALEHTLLASVITSGITMLVSLVWTLSRMNRRRDIKRSFLHRHRLLASGSVMRF